MESTTIIIKFLFSFALLIAILRIYWALSSRLYSRVNKHFKLILSPVIAPGVIIHELSHAFFCIVLLRRIKSMKLYTFNHSTGELGYVEYSHKSRGPFTYLADTLIAFAPLAGGVTAPIILGVFLLPPEVISYMKSELTFILKTATPLSSDFWTETSGLYYYVLTNINYGASEVLWLFLVVSISHGAAPSSADLKLATPGIFIFAAIFVALTSLLTSNISHMESIIFQHLTLLLSIITSLSIPTALLLIVVWASSKLLSIVNYLKTLSPKGN